MNHLFEPAAIGLMTVANRFVRSATWEGLATENGMVTPKLIDLTAALARGGVGLIISSHAFVRPEGQAGPGQIGVHTEEHVSGLSQLAAAAHAHGAKMVLQLAHAGCFAAEALTGKPAWAVSAPPLPEEPQRPVMPKAEIHDLVDAFAAAAERAKAAGFDGVQIHSAHGYLLSQFLSPLYNRRTDEYGGPLENRVRAHREVLAAVRGKVGRDYPVLIKMNGQDFVEGGLDTQDALQAALLLESDGLDALELSGGWLRNIKRSPARVGINTEAREAYHQAEAQAFRIRLRIPLILVGGIRSFELADRLVSEGLCDFISMSRPFIREPDLVNRWKSGDRRKAACKSDNLCFEPARKGIGIYCVTAEREQKS